MGGGNRSVNRDRSALLIIDLQPDFMPGGALPVSDGDRIVEPIAELMRWDLFSLCVATQDWHPPGHISFASSHPGRESFDEIQLYGRPQTLWPDHCVQGSSGAGLVADIPWDQVSVILRKGMDPQVDSYSGFRNNWNSRGERPGTGLTGYLREMGIWSVYLCGLARDVCVKWSAEDAVAEGFETTLLWDLSRAVDPRSDAQLMQGLQHLGVVIEDSGSLDDASG